MPKTGLAIWRHRATEPLLGGTYVFGRRPLFALLVAPRDDLEGQQRAEADLKKPQAEAQESAQTRHPRPPSAMVASPRLLPAGMRKKRTFVSGEARGQIDPTRTLSQQNRPLGFKSARLRSRRSRQPCAMFYSRRSRGPRGRRPSAPAWRARELISVQTRSESGLLAALISFGAKQDRQ
jgi:hypothetical protein